MKRFLLSFVIFALTFFEVNAATVSSCSVPSPTSDVLLYWNNTTKSCVSLNVGTNLSITGGTLNASGGSTSPGGTSGQVQYNNSGVFGGFTLGGDATLNTGTGALTVTKTNGVSFATSATTNTTNAANISSGTLPSARLSGSYTGITGLGTVTAGTWNASVLAPLYGGFGQSMDQQSVSTATINALTPGLVKLTATSGTQVINGITAPSSSGFCFIQNVGVSAALITHQSGSASAANRIITETAATQSLQPNQSAMLYYDTVTTRWRLMDIGTITSATSPLSISTAGVLSMTQVSAGNNGWLSAGDYNTFSNKIGGAGEDKAVAFFNATRSITGDADYFNFDASKQQLGLQVPVADTAAVLHSKSDVAQTLSDANSVSATLTQFLPPVAPNSVNYTPIQPQLAKPQGTAAANSFTGSGYSSSDVVDYEIRPLYDDGAGGVTQGVAVQQITGISDVNPFDIDFNFTATPVSENLTANKWLVLRQINSGGYTDWQEFSSATGTDNNSGWTTGTAPLYTPANDFLANGTTYSSNFYGTKTSPISTTIISDAYNSPFTDSGTGDAYRLQIDISGGDTDAGTNINWNSTGYINGAVGTIYVGPQDFPSGSPTTAPTTYGYLADGSNLNRSYDFYAYQASPLLYSVNAVNATTSDPNDSNYYYVVLSAASTTGYWKIIRDGSVGLITNTTVNDDSVTSFSDGSGISPNSVYAPAFIAESHGSGLSSTPGIISKSLDGSYSRLEFQDNTGAQKGYLENVGTTLRVNAPDNVFLQVGGTSSLGAASTGGSLYGGGNTSATWDNYGLKINSANAGYNSGLEVQGQDNTRVTASFKLRSGQTNNLTQWLNASNTILAQVNYQGQGTFSGLNILEANNIVLGTTTGTKIGTSASQKLGFYNATPVIQQSGNIVTALSNLGLVTSGSLPAASLSGTVPIANGGTNATSYGANRLIFMNSANTAFSSDANLLWDGSTYSIGGNLAFLGTTAKNITTPASTALGTNGTTLNITTGAGFNAVSAGTFGSQGGTLLLSGGAGGSSTVSGSSSSNNGGQGSNIQITSGAGGAAGNNSNSNGPGSGGTMSFSSGNGGALSGGVAFSDFAGDGGQIVLAAGVGGATSTANTNAGYGGNFLFQLGSGGAATANGATAGDGGTMLTSQGTGGAATASGSGANTAGAGANIQLTAGQGGAASNSSTTNTAGKGGTVAFTGGTGGSSTAGSGTRIAGNGGDITFSGGTGGTATGTPGNGGSLYLVGGAPGSGGTNGNVYLGQTSGGTARGTVIAARPVRLKGYTVGTLPAGTQGDTAFVTDATAPTYLGALTGGGSVVTPVFYNGSAWVSY